MRRAERQWRSVECAGEIATDFLHPGVRVAAVRSMWNEAAWHAGRRRRRRWWWRRSFAADRPLDRPKVIVRSTGLGTFIHTWIIGLFSLSLDNDHRLRPDPNDLARPNLGLGIENPRGTAP
jgi:hypothetical protein